MLAVTEAEQQTTVAQLENDGAVVLLKPEDTFDLVNRLENFALAIKYGYVVEEKRLADIDAVVLIVNDLEMRRKRVHELLELESIKTSQFRSNFNEVKEFGEKEISDAVIAARQLNLGRMRALESEVHTLDNRIDFLKEDMARLEKENKELEVVRDESQVNYDEVVKELNRQLMKKADHQITLNEIRDQIKDTGEKIVEMEEDIIIQKEDLIHEREEAKVEKQQLVVDIEGEDKILKTQQAVNTEKRAELNVVLEDLKKTKSELKAARKIYEALTHDLNMLSQQEAELHGKISREHESIASIRKKLDDIKDARNAAQAVFNEKEADLKEKMRLLEQKCEFEDGQISEFQVKKKSIEDTEKQLKPKVKELVEREAAVTAALKAKKEELREVAERRADFDRRMQIANEQIISNTTLHKATMEQLTREFEQTKRLLMETREERDVAREKCDELAAEIAAARDEQLQYVDYASGITRQQEEELENLAKRRDELHASIKDCERQITTFQETIETETQEAAKMAREKTQILDDLTKQRDELLAEVNKNEETLSVERPAYQALKQEYADTSVECERLKREVVSGLTREQVKKNRVTEFELKLKQANDYIKYFPRLHTNLEADVVRSDRDMDASNTKWHREIMEVEREIVATWTKLKQVILENDHFNKAVNSVEEKIRHTESLLAANDLRQKSIDDMIEKEKLALQDQFSKFQDAQQRVRSQDQVDLDRYLVISELTGDRLDCVTGVLDGLNGNLDEMHTFLEVLSGNRKEDRTKTPVVEDDEPLREINA